MKLFRLLFLILLLAPSASVVGAEEPKNAPIAPKAADARAPDAPIYVGAWSVDHEWSIVTPECLKIIASKRILYGSRSWGLTIGGYVSRNAKPITWEGNKRISEKDMVTPDKKDFVIGPDAFKEPKIINFIFDPGPTRFTYFDDFLRKEPWKFGTKIDGALQTLYYIADKKNFEESYFPILDALVKDFPNVKFAVCTHDISASGKDLSGKEQPEASAWNIRGGDYSDAVVRKYYGKLPIFDIRDIVSTRADGTVASFVHDGKTYRKLVREYNKSGDLIHANSDEGSARLGKGFLILLTKMFCADKIPHDLKTPKPEILK